MHQYWPHVGILLASELKFFRYRISEDFLVCFSAPFDILKCFFGGPAGALKIIENHMISTILFNLILDPQRVGSERPRGSFDLILGQLFMFLPSFFAAFQHILKNRGGGWGRGEAQFPKSRFSVPKPFQHHNL